MRRFASWIVRAAVLVTLGSAIAPVSAAPGKPSLQKQTRVQKAEAETICSGNQIKSSLTNPVCMRWHIHNVGTVAAEDNLYLGSYKPSCLRTSNGAVTCYFPSPRETQPNQMLQSVTMQARLQSAIDACRAYADVRTQASALDNSTMRTQRPFCASGGWAATAEGQQQMEFNCGYCERNQNGCTPQGKRGRYLPGNVCFGTAGYTSFRLLNVVNELHGSICDRDVSGPYRLHSDSYEACGSNYTQTFKGMYFTSDQRRQIREINLNSPLNQTGKLRSDFTGFCWPKKPNTQCTETFQGSNICKEQPELVTFPFSAPNAAQVHHIMPRTDPRRCACGTNSIRNAALISRSLNIYFSNADRETLVSNCNDGTPVKTEIEFANDLQPHPVAR